MKNSFRLNLIVLTLALPFIIASCNDDNSVPNVQFNFSERGGIQHNGALYVENGDSICIDKISIIPGSDVPKAIISACDYYWDGFYVGPAFAPNFGRKFLVYNQREGKHAMSVRMLIAAEGYSLTTYVTSFPVIVTNSIDSITADGTDLFSLRN